MPPRTRARRVPESAEKLMQYDDLERKIMAVTGNDEDSVLQQQKAALDELFEAAALESEDTTIIQKDADVFCALINAKNARPVPVTTTFLRVLDAKELEDGCKRLLDLHGIDKVLDDVLIDFPDRRALPASVPRGFGEAVTRPVARREKKTREEGPAKHTVAFDQERQQNDEARAIKAIKIHLKTRYLRERMPISFYQFVLKHESFTQTVENVFYLSFLIRDNYVEVIKEDDPLETKMRPLFRRPEDVGTPEGEDGAEEEDEEDPFVVEGCDPSDYVVKTSGPRLLFLAKMKFGLWKQLCELYPDGGIPLRRSSDECQYTGGSSH